MKKHWWFKGWTSLVLLAVLLASVGSVTAWAAPAVQEGNTGADRLAEAFAREQEALTRLGEHFSRSDEVIAKTEAAIGNLQEHGVDTAPLETALAGFRAGVAEARTAYDQAAAILSTHAGFDENGQVTDPEQAQQTVQSAAQALRTAQQTLGTAARDFRQAVKSFRESLREQQQERLKEKLAQAYTRAMQALDKLSSHLERADQGIGKVEELIARLQERGVDTAPLEEALGTAREQLSAAHSDFEQAAAVLQAHAGFDENGQVTDIAQAKQTIQEGGAGMRSAQHTLAQAAKDLRQAVREFLQGLRGEQRGGQ